MDSQDCRFVLSMSHIAGRNAVTYHALGLEVHLFGGHGWLSKPLILWPPS